MRLQPPGRLRRPSGKPPARHVPISHGRGAPCAASSGERAAGRFQRVGELSLLGGYCRACDGAQPDALARLLAARHAVAALLAVLAGRA
jgi:hypothetical protein